MNVRECSLSENWNIIYIYIQIKVVFHYRIFIYLSHAWYKSPNINIWIIIKSLSYLHFSIFLMLLTHLILTSHVSVNKKRFSMLNITASLNAIRSSIFPCFTYRDCSPSFSRYVMPCSDTFIFVLDASRILSQWECAIESRSCRDWSSTETSRSARFGVLKARCARRAQTEFSKRIVNIVLTASNETTTIYCYIYETNDTKGKCLNTLWQCLYFI